MFVVGRPTSHTARQNTDSGLIDSQHTPPQQPPTDPQQPSTSPQVQQPLRGPQQPSTRPQVQQPLRGPQQLPTGTGPQQNRARQLQLLQTAPALAAAARPAPLSPLLSVPHINALIHNARTAQHLCDIPPPAYFRVSNSNCIGTLK